MEKYEILKRIGGGIEAKEKETTAKVAIKLFSLSDSITEEKIYKMINSTKSLIHQNLVNHFDHFVQVKRDQITNEDKKLFFVVMEYCDGGSLEDLLKDYKDEEEFVDKEKVYNYTLQLFEALKYLHSQNVMHRDIKSENVLLSTIENETLNRKRQGIQEEVPKDKNFVIKLGDFGFTAELNHSMLKSYKGTISFMSPEIIASKAYDESADIWSTGVIIFQLLSGKTSKELPNLVELIEKNPDFIYDQFDDIDFSDGSTKKLIETTFWCLQIDPSERPTAQEILYFLNDETLLNIRQKLTPQIITEFSGNVLDSIKSTKGREFWKASGWENESKVEWTEFTEKYLEYTNYHRLAKKELRGLKKLTCVTGTNTVTSSNFDEAIDSVGFPFDMNIVISFDEYQHIGEGYSLGLEGTPIDKYILLIKKSCVTVDSINQITNDLDSFFVQPRILLEEVKGKEKEKFLNRSYSKRINHMSLIEQNTPKPLKNSVSTLLECPKGSRRLLVGGASSGKSYMLKILLENLIEGLEMDKKNIIPIYIPLNVLSNFEEMKLKESLRDFKKLILKASANSVLNKGFQYSKAVEEFLYDSIEKKNVFLLFDGIDEVNEAHREYILQQLSKLSIENTDEMKIIISSKLHELEGKSEHFKNFQVINLLPFDLNLQLELTHKLGLFNEDFENYLKSGEHDAIASVPLLLTLVVREFQSTKQLPDKKSTLLKNAIDTMINIYFKKKNLKFDQEREQKERESIIDFLTAIAKKMFKDRKREFSQSDIDSLGYSVQSKWENNLSDIDLGLFPIIVPNPPNYCFCYTSFLDYLMSRVWANENLESDLRSMKKKGTVISKNALYSYSNAIIDRSLDYWYREALLMTAEIMSREDHKYFCRWLLKQAQESNHKFVLLAILMQIIEKRSTQGKDGETRLILSREVTAQKQLTLAFEGLLSKSKNLRRIAVKDLDNSLNVKTFLFRKVVEDMYICKEGLMKIGEDPKNDLVAQYVSYLKSQSNQKNAQLISTLIIAIAYCVPKGYEQIIPEILPFYNHDSPQVRISLIKALKRLTEPGNQKIVKTILEMAKSVSNVGIYKSQYQSVIFRTLRKITNGYDIVVIETIFATMIRDIHSHREALLTLCKIVGKPSQKFIIEMDLYYSKFPYWYLLPEVDSFYEDVIKYLNHKSNVLGDENEITKILNIIQSKDVDLVYRIFAVSILNEFVDHNHPFLMLNIMTQVENQFRHGEEEMKLQCLKVLNQLYFDFGKVKKYKKSIEQFKKNILQDFFRGLIDSSSRVRRESASLINGIVEKGNTEVLNTLEDLFNDSKDIEILRAICLISPTEKLIEMLKIKNHTWVVYETLVQRMKENGKQISKQQINEIQSYKNIESHYLLFELSF